ncbi:MFS transporter, partial [Nesterenkonia sp. F]|uniref:MFS transporter n=1 Tax=Nesterenkonia sp. F TaxID=795955 RepID=UPI000255C853
DAWAILRADRSEEEAAAELEEIHAIRQAETAAGVQRLTALLQPWIRPILVVGIVVAVLQQIMGANAIIYYAPTTLQNVGFSDQAAVASNLIIGIMNILAVWLALTYADRWGRRPLLLAGAAGMALSLGVLAFTNLMLPEPDGFGLVGIVTLTCMAVYIFLFQASWGSMTWVVLGEIFPLGVRAAAMAVATTALWIGNGIVALGFPPVLEAVGVGWAFAGFAVICCAGLAFTWRRIPETTGRSLEEIETSFNRGAGVDAADSTDGATIPADRT